MTTETKKAQVARLLRADIESGRLHDGQVLPSTRALAKQYETSVYTIASAMDLLAEDGLIESEAGSRRTVRAPGVAPGPIRPARPRLVLVGGYAGSGKTETGRLLARATGWPILDKDTLTRPVVEALLEQLGVSPHDRESATYLERVRPAEYESLLAVVAENIECGVSVIATAPFIRELSDGSWMERVRARVEAAGGDLTVIWVRCDIPTMLTYIRRRSAARDAHKVATWDDYAAALDLNFRPHGEHVIIDNSATARPLREQVAEVLAGMQCAASV